MESFEFTQLDLLYKIEKLRQKKASMATKAKVIDKTQKLRSDEKMTQNIDKMKKTNEYVAQQLQKLHDSLDVKFDFFTKQRKRNETIALIKNLKKSRKKKEIDETSFNTTLAQYRQHLDLLDEALGVIKEAAGNYFDRLKEELLNEEDQRIEKKETKKEAEKEEYKASVQKTEQTKKEIRDKMKFLKYQVFGIKW